MRCKFKDDSKQSSSSLMSPGSRSSSDRRNEIQAPACCWFGKFLFYSRHFRGEPNELPENWGKKCVEEAIKISSTRGYPQVEKDGHVILFS